MYKLLFDSDALIKSAKSQILEKIIGEFDILITGEVYQETVEEGKKRLYEDAEKIGTLVKENKIKLIKAAKNIPLREKILGKGEASVFRAYKKNIIIVTDDLSFTSFLKDKNANVLSSAHMINILLKRKKINKIQALQHLDKLSPFIRNELYDLIKNEIGE